MKISEGVKKSFDKDREKCFFTITNAEKEDFTSVIREENQKPKIKIRNRWTTVLALCSCALVVIVGGLVFTRNNQSIETQSSSQDVSATQDNVAYSQYIGQEAEMAIKSLETEGYNCIRENEFSNDIGFGNITRIERKSGENLMVYISKGTSEENSELISLVNTDAEEGISKLEELGYSVSRIEKETDVDDEVGKIIKIEIKHSEDNDVKKIDVYVGVKYNGNNYVQMDSNQTKFEFENVNVSGEYAYFIKDDVFYFKVTYTNNSTENLVIDMDCGAFPYTDLTPDDVEYNQATVFNGTEIKAGESATQYAVWFLENGFSQLESEAFFSSNNICSEDMETLSSDDEIIYVANLAGSNGTKVGTINNDDYIGWNDKLESHFLGNSATSTIETLAQYGFESTYKYSFSNDYDIGKVSAVNMTEDDGINEIEISMGKESTANTKGKARLTLQSVTDNLFLQNRTQFITDDGILKGSYSCNIKDGKINQSLTLTNNSDTEIAIDVSINELNGRNTAVQKSLKIEGNASQTVSGEFEVENENDFSTDINMSYENEEMNIGYRYF